MYYAIVKDKWVFDLYDNFDDAIDHFYKLSQHKGNNEMSLVHYDHKPILYPYYSQAFEGYDTLIKEEV